MHEHRFYGGDVDDRKDITLSRALRKGSQIEHLDANSYKGTSQCNILRHRIHERIQILAKGLMNKGLIDDTLQQTHHFRVAWENREAFWDETAQMSEIKVGGSSSSVKTPFQQVCSVATGEA